MAYEKQNDPLKRVIQLAISAYHTTRFAGTSPEDHVAVIIRDRLAQEGIQITQTVDAAADA